VLRFPRPLSALAALLVVLSVAGCGGDKSDSDQIKSLARDWAGNIHDKNWNDVCKDFSLNAHAQIRQVAQQLRVTSCSEVMQAAFGRPDNPLQSVTADQVKVTNVKVDGTHATADMTPSADKDPMTYFLKEKGDWKIDADPEPASGETGDTGPSGSKSGSGSKKSTGTTTSGSG
jgi:hypothetical protein